MRTSSFLGAISRSAGRRYELVHVESGAVLASRLAVGEVSRPRRKEPPGRQPGDGGEQAVLVGPARWAHTFRAAGPVDIAFVGENGTVLRILPALKPWRMAISRGAHAVIEADAGFFERTGTHVGDRVALREAQPARPARDVTSWRSQVEAVPDSVRAAARESVRGAIGDLDAASDPWDFDAADLEAVEVRPESASQKMPAGAVDLATLVARQTPVAWFEAVAIAQQFHAALLSSRGAGKAGVPELGDIAITAEGDVEILAAGRAGEQPVPGSARLLLALLGESQTLPVQLRLLVLQEVSPAPACRTLLEFSTRLALFERPGRQNTIRDVYERFQRLPPLPAEPPVREAGADARPARVKAPGRIERSILVAGAASVLVVALGAAAVWVWSMRAAPRQGATDGRGPLSRAAAEAGASVTEAAARSVRSIAKWFGGDSGARPASPAPAQPVASPAGPPSAPARRRTAPPAAPAAMAAPQPAAPAPDAVAPAPVDATIYTDADTDVVPPKLLRSRLPADPGAGLRAESLPEVELIVSSNGEVESVRLVTPQAGVRSAMMLSAIKSWRFGPATRNAQPVRYRLLMRLTSQ